MGVEILEIAECQSILQKVVPTSMFCTRNANKAGPCSVSSGASQYTNVKQTFV